MMDKVLNKNKGLSFNKLLLYFSIIMFAILSYFAAYSKEPLVTFVSLGFLLIIVILADKSVLTGILISTAIIDMETISILGNTLTYSRIVTVIIILSILIDRKFRLDMKTLFVVFILTASSLSTIFYIDISPLFAWVLNLLILIALQGYYFSENKMKDIIKIVLIFGLVHVFVLFLGLLFQPYIYNIYNGRRSIFQGVDINRQSIAFALFAAFFVSYAMTVDRAWTKVVYFLATIISAIAIYLAGSRTSLFAILIGIFIVFMTNKYKQNRILKISLSIILFAGLIAVFLTDNFISQSLGRFSLTEIISSSGSNRFTTYPIIFKEIIPKYFLFGVGIGGQEIAITKLGYNIIYYPAAHNFLISSLAELGIFGFSSMMFLIFSSWLVLKKNAKYISNTYILWVVFTVLLICGLGETVYSEKITFVIIGLVFLKNIDFTRRLKKDDNNTNTI